MSTYNLVTLLYLTIHGLGIYQYHICTNYKTEDTIKILLKFNWDFHLFILKTNHDSILFESN